MAKHAVRGVVTSFRRGKQVQHHMYETIVAIGEGGDAATLLGAKAVWTGTTGRRIVGRVTLPHGRHAVRVRWRKGFPPGPRDPRGVRDEVGAAHHGRRRGQRHKAPRTTD